MSYILDSLKKSDKERRSIDTSAAIVMRSPAFLDNDKKQPSYKWLFISMVIFALLVAAYYLLPYFEGKYPILQLSGTPAIKSEAPKKAAALKPAVRAERVSSEEKEQAVLLYQQALANKSRPEIDSLYQKLNEDTDASEATEEPSAAAEAAEVVVTPAPVEEAETQAEIIQPEPVSKKAPAIPSIYEIDAYTRKTIPSVDYGAHIYATDNNSGFVILDGARRRVGDKLDSGLYVEKIEEESVVLSYKGTLFSLPAMKSWQGK